MSTYAPFDELHPLDIGRMMPNDNQAGAAASACKSEYDLGLMLQAQGRLTEAAIHFEEALAADPGFAPAHDGLGVVLRRLGHPEKAVAHFRRALALDPTFAPSHNNLGWLLKTKEHIEDAAIHFERALALQPNYGESCIGLGQISLARGRFKDAEVYFARALAISSKYAAAHYGLGYVLRVKGQLEAADAAFQHAIKLRPNFSLALAQLVYLLHSTCQWKRLREWAPKLDTLTTEQLRRGETPGDGPVGTMRYCSDLSRHLDVARIWSRELCQRAAANGLRFPFDGRRNYREKLRIGYASGTFGDHPVAHYIRGLIARHDRRNFEVFLYSYTSDDGSEHRAAIRAASDLVVDISALSPTDAAAKIHNDEIDILVDLDGYTPQGRPAMFAFRPAPIQVAYLGFVATTGADFIDYIVGDRTVIPGEHSCYYTEKIIYMPSCFTVDSSSARTTVDKCAKRSDYGLPENEFVFCCFNIPSKIDSDIFNRWMSIMRAIPASVLWLYRDNAIAEKNLEAEAIARGVDGRRLIFADRVSFAAHIDRIRLADLALDTSLYNGGATTSNALAAGVPVVTLLGNRFANRMTASMVRAVRLPELVAHTLDDYEGLVLELVQNPSKLSAMRGLLRLGRDTFSLFDERRFARNLEKAFQEVWEIFRAGEEPRQIDVVET